MGDTDVSLKLDPGPQHRRRYRQLRHLRRVRDRPAVGRRLHRRFGQRSGFAGRYRHPGFRRRHVLRHQFPVRGLRQRRPPRRSTPPRPEVDLTGLSLGGEYDFGNGLSMYGSIGRMNIDVNAPVSFGATGMTLGVAYDLAQAGMGPMNAERRITPGPLSILTVCCPIGS